MTDATVPDLVEPEVAAGERDTLAGFLDYQRAVMARKAHGLDHEQLNRPHPPSTLTLAKLLRHLTLVEHIWFHERFLGWDPAEPWASAPWDEDVDWEMTTASTIDPVLLLASFHAVCEESRRITARAASLDQLSVRCDGSTDKPWNLRWILVHMIEEYARHLGHADFLREAIDGAVGD